MQTYNRRWCLKSEVQNDNWRSKDTSDFRQRVLRDILTSKLIHIPDTESVYQDLKVCLIKYGFLQRFPLIITDLEFFISNCITNLHKEDLTVNSLIYAINNMYNRNLIPNMDDVLCKLGYKLEVYDQVKRNEKFIKNNFCIMWGKKYYSDVMSFITGDIITDGKINKNCIALDPAGRWILEFGYGINIPSLMRQKC